MNATNWTLNTYTNNTWTDLIPAVSVPTIIKGLTAAATSGSANVQVRVANASGSRAVLVPASTLLTGVGYSLNIPGAVTLVSGDKLQIQVDVAGVQFAAFGAQ